MLIKRVTEMSETHRKRAWKLIAEMMNRELKLDEERTATSVAKSDTRFYIAFDYIKEHKKMLPVGFSGLRDAYKNRVCEIRHTVILPQFRKRGYAKKFNQYFVEILRLEGYRKAIAHTNSKNIPIIKTKISSGWVKEGCLKEHYKDGSDVYIWAKMLEQPKRIEEQSKIEEKDKKLEQSPISHKRKIFGWDVPHETKFE